MSACHVQASATIELYFYGELTGDEREAVTRHLSTCVDCRRAIEELTLIRAALASCPVVEAPPGGDWSGFMARLEGAVQGAGNPAAVDAERAERIVAFPRRRWVATAVAMAALVALVTMSVLTVVQDRGAQSAPPAQSAVDVAGVAEPQLDPQHAGLDAALASVSEQHFTRSKLVVLGLATKDPADSNALDWDYERTLATSLLSDTRLYRQAAEERGMRTLADVMRDLELVLLQTSMSDEPDAESLAQLQRLIRRRDLITKMDVVDRTGLLP